MLVKSLGSCRQVPTRIFCTWWYSHRRRRPGTAAGCCSPCRWSCSVASPRSPACRSALLPCYPPDDAAYRTSLRWRGSSFCSPSKQMVCINRHPAVNPLPSPDARQAKGSVEKGSSCLRLSGEKCKKSLLSSSAARRVQITCCCAAHWLAGHPIPAQEDSVRKSLQSSRSSSSPVNETHRRVSANVVSAVVQFLLHALSRLPGCRVLVRGA